MEDEVVVNPFDGYEPLPGLEHLGRHIVDEAGAPSGSPANFERLRGRTGVQQITAEEKAALIEHLKAEFPTADESL